MKTKQLFVPMALVGFCLGGTTPASAALISFTEDPNETASISVTTDITNSVIVTGLESASLSLGNVTGEGTLLFRRQMVNMGSTPVADRRRVLS
jgi:hypothetical protein